MPLSEILDRLFSPQAFLEALVTALVFAWIAGRLLGARRRSWKAVVMAGASGWLAAVIVASALVGGGPETSSFRAFYLVLILLFVLLATVAIEVWAKPGAPLAGPTFSVPHPIRAIKRRYQVTRRLAEITRIAVRHGLGGFLGIRRSKATGEEPTAMLAVRARQAIEEAGGMFVKLGQLAAGRSDLIGEEAAAEFSKLQDAVPPSPPEEVRRLVEDELGRPFNEAFSEFEWEPLGAASIGQAHLARLANGQRVIVKVQRPGIAELVNRDLQIVARLAAIAEARTNWGQAYGVSALAEDFSVNLLQELDYRVEATNARQVAAAISHIELIHIPVIYDQLSTSRILVMELLDGSPLSHVRSDGDWNTDPNGLVEAMLQAEIEPMLNGERFHADPHPGNVFLLTDGRLGLVDFGATGRLDAFEQSAVTDIMLGLQTSDPEMLREAVLSVGILRKEVDGRALERSFARFMAKHIGTGAAPSSAMFNDLLQMLTSFGILLPASTSAMFRALVTVEGTINALVPGYPIIDAAQQIGGNLVRDQFDQKRLKEMAEQEAIKLAPVIRRIPRHVDRIASIIQQGELTGRVSLFSTQRDLAAVKFLLGRVVLVFVGASIMLISVLLLGTETGPALSEDTSLLQMLGYIGLFLGLVLVLRVTLAALRDTEESQL